MQLGGVGNVEQKQPGTFLSEVEETLFTCLEEPHAGAFITPLHSDVPTWAVTVGEKTSQVTLYDVEERRSVSTSETPGLNELQSTREAVLTWFKDAFH